MGKHLTLRTKFILTTNLMVVLLVASAAILAEIQQRNAIIEEVKKRALILASGLADASTNSLVTYNYVGVEQSLAVATRSPDVVYAVVLDKEGNVAASSIRDTPSRRILLEEKEPAPAGTDPLIRQRRIPGSPAETVYDVAVPVMVGLRATLGDGAPGHLPGEHEPADRSNPIADLRLRSHGTRRRQPRLRDPGPADHQAPSGPHPRSGGRGPWRPHPADQHPDQG